MPGTIICIRCHRLAMHGVWTDIANWTLYGHREPRNPPRDHDYRTIIQCFAEDGNRPSNMSDVVYWNNINIDGTVRDMGLCPRCRMSNDQIRNLNTDGE